MCGRFGLWAPIENIKQRFDVELAPGVTWKPSYNIAPTRVSPIIITTPKPQLVLASWGLVPFWAKDPSIGNSLINARSETVATKPAFRHSFEKKRCLVPFNHFFEWHKTGKAKEPYAFDFDDGRIAAFAGLYSMAEIDGHELTSFTILTTEPNALSKPIHDRMPVILPKEKEARWLDAQATPAQLQKLLVPSKDPHLRAFEIGPEVNSPRNDSKNILQPVKVRQQRLF